MAYSPLNKKMKPVITMPIRANILRNIENIANYKIDNEVWFIGWLHIAESVDELIVPMRESIKSAITKEIDNEEINKG